jgi:cysteine synthase A
MKVENVLNLIGKTPVLRINRIFGPSAEVWIKLERQNPGGSIKDRIALSMIEEAESRGILKPSTVIIEPTSGNTGIGLAMVAAVKGYRVILVMPESMSLERRKLMTAYGAEIELTPRELGMKGAIDRAKQMCEEVDTWMPMQFTNPANPEIHSRTTAMEILQDFPDGLDYLVTGVGTGGHITGIARVLRKSWPGIRIVAVEPADSPVISGGKPGPHALQGLGAGFIPGNLEVRLLDRVVQVSKEDAFEYARRAAKQEGLLVGISTGASLAAIAGMIGETGPAKTLTVAYDTGERYLSVEGLW